MFIFRCGGKSDLTSEDRERSNQRWPPVQCSNVLNFGTKHCRKTFKVSFLTKLGMPIHLVILLRSPEFKGMHLGQGQGQN